MFATLLSTNIVWKIGEALNAAGLTALCGEGQGAASLA